MEVFAAILGLIWAIGSYGVIVYLSGDNWSLVLIIILLQLVVELAKQVGSKANRKL